MGSIEKKEHFISNTSRGFTLIEIALVVIIIGILVIPLLQMYKTYYEQQSLDKTKEHIEIVQSLVNGFSTSRYPCPADPLLSPSDALYGVEQCAVTGGITSDPGGQILIGAVPIKTLKQSVSNLVADNVSLDFWGNKLLYAVTISLTNSATYTFNGGKITALNEFGNNTAGINGDGHYVVLSHGPDGNGAYTESGPANSACTPGVRVEDENCDDDATFIAALGFYEGAAANYYDDFVYFGSRFNSNLWSPVVNGSTNIYNTNSGNVGIKTNTPTEKLDVNGDLVALNNTKVTQICDYSGTKCFDVDKISGAGMSCPAGKAMIGITNGGPDCATVTFAAIADADCGAGKWVHGLRTDGKTVCTDGTNVTIAP